MFKSLHFKSFLLFMLAMFIGGVNSAWAEDPEVTTVATFDSDEAVTNSTYASTYGGNDWSISMGGNNKSIGFNNKNCTAINDNLGTDATSDNYGVVVKSKNLLANVNRITFEYSGGSGDGGKLYLAYSTDGSTWNAVSLKSGTGLSAQGVTVAMNTTFTFEFETISSAYYGFILDSGGTKTAAYRFDNVIVNFLNVEEETPSETTTTVTIDATDITNTDVYTNTSAGSLAATVNDNAGQAISGASVTWSSSDEGVATIAANGAVTLVAAGTTTITATYAGVSGTYDPSSATYELTVIDSNAPGTVNNPYTVAEAIANTPSSGTTANVYIKGIVSQFFGADITDDDYHRYYISDDGTTSTQLLVFGGKGLNDVAFSSADDLLLGDEVVIVGQLKTYSNAPEVAGDNYIVTLNRKQMPDLAFEEDSYEVAILGALTITASSTNSDGAITYESSNTAVAEIDATTGAVTPVSAGTTTIIATIAATADVRGTSVTTELTVIDPNAPTEKWVLVDPANLQTGDIVVIVDQTSSKAMDNTHGASSAPAAVTVTLKDDKSEITSAVDETIQWEVSVDEDVVEEVVTRTYQFGVGDDFLYVTKTNNGVRVGSGVRNVFTMETGGDNNGYYLYNGDDSDNRYVGCYNENDWRCYGSINTNIKGNNNAFYKKSSTLPVTITTAGAASFSCGYALDFSQVEGITAYKATAVNETTVHLEEVEQVPARAGVIIKTSEELTEDKTYQVPVATGDVAALDGNLLVGTVNGTFTVEAADYGKVYKYVKTKAGVVGFQKAKVDWTCQAGHAYLKLSETPAREYLNIFGEEPIDDVATGIEAIDNSQLTIDNDAPAYNLAGQKVGKGYKGIVVKNGKKYVK